MELGEEREIAPGVFVERRCLLLTLASLIGTLTVPAMASRRVSPGPISFEEFLKDVVPEARRLVTDTSAKGQDLYLKTVAAHALRLADVAPPEMRDSGQGAGPGTFIGFNPGGDPFTVLHWRMDPFSRIRTHAHTYGNVVTLGLEGSAEVVNFEVQGEPDYSTTGPFQVRRTNRQILKRGRTNLVNLERDYIHGIRAGGNGARGLDITTRLRAKAPTPYLVLKDSDSAVSEATWSFDAS